MKRIWLIFLLVPLLTILVGCSTIATSIDDDSFIQPTIEVKVDVTPTSTEIVPSSTRIDDPEEEAMTGPTDIPNPIEFGLEPLITQAKEDLAQRLSIPVDQIVALEAKAVVWPDSSLGCPQPGMKYRQVPMDGALIVLQAQGLDYQYHSGGGRGLFLCEKVYKDPNPPPQIDIANLTPQVLDKNNPPPTTPDNGIPPGEDQ
jgi:hypothetical protein